MKKYFKTKYEIFEYKWKQMDPRLNFNIDANTRLVN